MRAAKLLAVLAIAAVGIGSFSAVALARKPLKNKVKVDFCDPALSSPDPKWVCHGPNPTFDKSGLVIAQVELFQRGAIGPCFESRSLRLQVLNTNGVVLTTLDSTRTGKREKIRTLSGQLPTTLPAGTNYVRVKMKQRTVGKVVQSDPVKHSEGRDVCQAGFTRNVAIPAA
jgi:hypothetical protein